MKRLWFWRKSQPPGDMATTPIDNPLDYRKDGSIRPGDPAWEFMRHVLEGGSASACQREDGTWEVDYR